MGLCVPLLSIQAHLVLFDVANLCREMGKKKTVVQAISYELIWDQELLQFGPKCVKIKILSPFRDRWNLFIITIRFKTLWKPVLCIQ